MYKIQGQAEARRRGEQLSTRPNIIEIIRLHTINETVFLLLSLYEHDEVITNQLYPFCFFFDIISI